MCFAACDAKPLQQRKQSLSNAGARPTNAAAFLTGTSYARKQAKVDTRRIMGCAHPTFALKTDATEDRCAVPQHNVIKPAQPKESSVHPRLSNGFWNAVGEVCSKEREQRC